MIYEIWTVHLVNFLQPENKKLDEARPSDTLKLL